MLLLTLTPVSSCKQCQYMQGWIQGGGGVQGVRPDTLLALGGGAKAATSAMQLPQKARESQTELFIACVWNMKAMRTL